MIGGARVAVLHHKVDPNHHCVTLSLGNLLDSKRAAIAKFMDHTSRCNILFLLAMGKRTLFVHFNNSHVRNIGALMVDNG
jgi:hypothetical protein